MLRWFLAIVAVPLVSIAISVAMFSHQQARYAQDLRYTPEQARQLGLWREIEAQHQAVSLVALLANPDRYDGREVLVSGFVTLRHEGYGLYLDSTSYASGQQKNAIALSGPKWLSKADARRLDRRYARVAGTFEASDLGIYNLYSGALIGVRGIDPTRRLHAVGARRAARGLAPAPALRPKPDDRGLTALWIFWLFVRRRT